MRKKRRGRLRFQAGAHRYSPGIGMAEVADDYAKALRALCVQPIIRYAILLEVQEHCMVEGAIIASNKPPYRSLSLWNCQ